MEAVGKTAVGGAGEQPHGGDHHPVFLEVAHWALTDARLEELGEMIGRKPTPFGQEFLADLWDQRERTRGGTVRCKRR